MTKEKLNISLLITIATIIVSISSSFAIVKAKTDKIDKLEDKAEDVDKRLIKVEVNLDNIDESLKEQKVVSKEMKDDLKQVIKLLMEK